MVVTLLVAASVLSLLHLYYFEGKTGKVEYIYFGVLLVVMGLNSQNADYDAYRRMYQAACDATSTTEVLRVHADKGYAVLNWLFSLTGIDYITYRFVLFSLLLGVIFLLTKKLGAPVCILYLAYMMYPMFMDIIQVRNYIISVLFLVSVYCYAHGETKWDITGVALMLLAVTIQPLAAIYLMFIVFYKIYDSKRFRIITYIPIGLGLFSLVIKFFIDAYWEDITSILYRLAAITSRGGSYVDDLVLTSIHFKIYLVVLIFTWLLYKAKQNVNALYAVSKLQKRFIDLSFVAYLYMICWAPFFALNLNFATRLPRNLFLLAYISLGIYIYNCTVRRKKMIMVIGIAFLAFFFGLVDLYMSSERFNVEIIIENNFLLN